MRQLIKRAILALLATAAFAAQGQTVPTIRVGWTIPAEEAKYMLMRRPQEFPSQGKTYKIEWVQFQGTAPMVQAAQVPMAAHVFTLHAELEGMRLLPVFEKLLSGWKDQGYELVPADTVYRNLNRAHLPYYEAQSGSVSGRSGHLLLQGKPFLPIQAEVA